MTGPVHGRTVGLSRDVGVIGPPGRFYGPRRTNRTAVESQKPISINFQFGSLQ